MIDSEFILKEAGLVASSAAGATSAGTAIVADVGNGKITGELVIDVSAIEIASNNEKYSIALQGSDTSDFSTGTPVNHEICCINLGAAEVLGGNQDSTTGRYTIAITNTYKETPMQYLRTYCTCSGTIATGINYSAHIRPIGR